MNARDVATLRLVNQGIANPTSANPSDVVSRLLAIQAQDYRGALWSIGLRLGGSAATKIERAIVERTIVRTWPMRRTLHFVSAMDVRWMLRLLAPRAINGMIGRLRQLEIDDVVLSRSREALVKALRDGALLTRDAMYDELARAKISTEGQRGIHILSRLSQEGLLCFGPHRGKHPTFALLAEWIRESRDLEREEALAELTSRYFRGHGPATIRDFARWSGITLRDARAGAAMLAAELAETRVGDITYIMARDSVEMSTDERRAARALYLLPGFDEYLLGYSDRSIALDLSHAQKVVPGNNGVFFPTIVLRGRVVGTWRSAATRTGLAVTPRTFAALKPSEARAFTAAAKRYEQFVREQR